MVCYAYDCVELHFGQNAENSKVKREFRYLSITRSMPEGQVAEPLKRVTPVSPLEG